MGDLTKTCEDKENIELKRTEGLEGAGRGDKMKSKRDRKEMPRSAHFYGE